ncbi:serine protease [Halalkalibacter wakoensis JCM 9140]|uniref:Serine protease n=1 Tax=Halalkalibacter wakoensis JCM 9140 TaxID=1236970 RepID=W4Q2L6_9BACI|nr:trypsin-like peptidase domain-containing protein [Halalkalibacter wakoensis]GAE26232.1 serine protease [Halalkalibacter wakoensis JCM 9140]
MGYYDDHSTDQVRTRRDSQKRGVPIVAAFIGSIIGGLCVLFSMPILSNYGLLPYTIQTEPESIAVFDSETPQQGLQAVNLDVNSDVTQAVDRVSDAVVGVINMRQSSFFSSGDENEGTGSGVIYKKSGDKAYVVTNHHVIDGANEIEVSLADGTRVPAELLGTDVITDLAVLEIDGGSVETVAEFGSSDTLRVGEPALAIGNPLGLRFSSTVTQGIISATERSIPVDLTGNGQVDWHAEVLQTDAAINPGNSGGALVNIEGQVIGINSMKIAQSSVEGIGFAIPTAIAIPVIEDLETLGEVRRPQLGVGIRSLSEIPSSYWQETLRLPEDIKGGVVITSIAPTSPADRAGLQDYDVIVEIDGVEIGDSHDLRKFLYTEKRIGEDVEVTIYRNGNREVINVQLAEQQSF